MFNMNEFVLTPAGRVGVVCEIKGRNRVVQLGSGGPFEEYAFINLRHATHEQVMDAGLLGLDAKIMRVSTTRERRQLGKKRKTWPKDRIRPSEETYETKLDDLDESPDY